MSFRDMPSGEVVLMIHDHYDSLMFAPDGIFIMLPLPVSRAEPNPATVPLTPRWSCHNSVALVERH
jgi:hypothetical protein